MDVNPKFNIPKNQNHIAVGVSGGGDSMALAHMVCVWAVEHDKQIHLLTVNHNLRDYALAEAERVGEWVKNFPNATHHILTWNYDNNPEAAVMEQARNARYDLMHDYCVENDIQTLCIAHHADDNLETFLFRLAKGSGLDGLTGMREWVDFKDIQIYRPLLNMTHDDLIEYCLKNRIDWIEDPSNRDEKYARPRLRNALADEGLDAKRFAKTVSRLSRAQDALNWMVETAINTVTLKNEGEIDFEELMHFPIDIQIRTLQKTIADVGNVTHSYPPKLERIEGILATIKPSKSATLHGCVLSLSKDGNTLEIKRS